jgi:4-amino-4-deoxy-L-arabinose transferase-like glycosyltransferase
LAIVSTEPPTGSDGPASNPAPPGRLRRSTPLFVVLLLALGLRVVHLDYGLPESFHPDELFVVGPALRIVAEGQFDPHFYNYPALTSYVLAAVYAVEGTVAADPAGPDIPRAVHIARWVTLVFGLATIVAVYAAGALWNSRRIGLLAALLLAMTPFHALSSHYANVDVPMTLWVVVSLCFALRFLRSGLPGPLLLASASVGMAGASKYTALVLVVLPAAACLLENRSGRERWRRIRLGLAGFLASLATFSACAPYTWIRFDAFRQALAFEGRHVSTGHWGWDLNVGGWIYQPVVYQLLAGLPFVLGVALYLAALGGAFDALRRPRRETLLLWAALLPILAVVCWSRVVFPRYLLPCLPILALLAAGFFGSRLSARVGTVRRAIGLVLLALTLAYTSALAVSQLIGLSPRNARLASDWIVRNVAPGSEIAVATLVETHGIPRGTYDVGRFDLERALSSGGAVEWLVIDSWYETAYERGTLRYGPANSYLKALGTKDSAYREVVAFESTFFTERLYGRLDPYFKNQFESPDYTIYRRRATR